jgi:hypothetical protein
MDRTDIKLTEPQKFLQLWDKANCFLTADEIKKLQHSQIVSPQMNAN